MSQSIEICSHTLVKNGMPFIEPVLRQVMPFVTRSLVTISKSSDDGTKDVLKKLSKEFPKIELSYEDVPDPGLLTTERQKQLGKTTENWVLFLDDDDFWPTESINEMKELVKRDEDVDGYAFRPYQIVSSKEHDFSWRYRYFTKLFKNQPGTHYRHPWPRDLIYLNDTRLYWRKTKGVPRVKTRFLHLSYIKGHSFRNEEWSEDFGLDKGWIIPLDEPGLKYMEELNGYFKRDKQRRG